MHNEAGSEQGISNDLASLQKPDSEPKLTLPGTSGRGLTRRRFNALAAGFLASPRLLPAQSEADFQSHLMLQALGPSVAPFLDPLDQASINVYGERAFPILRGQMRGKPLLRTGDHLQELSLQRVKGAADPESIGWCEGASVAAGHCPLISGPKEAFGVVMPFVDRMILATWYHSNCYVADEWPSLTPETYKAGNRLQEQLANEGRSGIMVANTAPWRKTIGEYWALVVDYNDGRNANLVSFTWWEELTDPSTTWDGRPKTNRIVVPGRDLSPLRVIDPTRPREGQDVLWGQVFHRDIAAVFLDLA